MKVIFIILIAIGSFITTPSFAADCDGKGVVIFTNPLSGAKTLHDSITVRGYLCAKHPVVYVKNLTTKKSQVVATDQVCGRSGCTYHFSVPMRGLAMGANKIRVEVAGQNPPLVATTIVTRTALAGL